jgi:CHAT domain-containing protein/Tfp pilus assembly protein PilF
MGVCRIYNVPLLALVLLVAGVVTFGSARAQSDDELKALNQRVFELHRAGKFREAIPIAKEFVTAARNRYGEVDPVYATAISWLAQLLQDTGQFAEAEPLVRRTLALDETSFGPEHPKVAVRLNNLARLLQDTNRLAEAEPLYRRALAINEKSFSPEHPNVVRDLSNLAQLLKATNRLAEAEPLYRRALAIDEKSLGPDHLNVAIHLNNLAQLLQATNRLAEAEPLMRRVIAIFEKSVGPEHPNVAISLNNLAQLLRDTNHLSEAEALLRRALAIDEKTLGPDHPNVAIRLNNLARLLQDTNRFSEAEPMMRRVITIFEKSLGPEHTSVATALNNLAGVLQATNRLADAEPLLRRVITIFEKSLGPDHPNVAAALTNLAVMRAERDDWAGAAALGGRAKPALTARKIEEGGGRIGIAKAALASNTWALRFYARAQYRASPDSASAREEGFELAQWALQTGAADALSQMSVRFAKGVGPLASLVRERQEFLSRRQGELRRLDAAAGRADARAAEDARAALVAVDKQLDAIDARLAAEFPEYAELANPKPLTIAAVQALLRSDEALVVFLDVRKIEQLSEESLAWVVTKNTVRWRSIALGTGALGERVATLRCGLDASSWDDTSEWPQETALDKQRIGEQLARRNRCKALLRLTVSSDELPPFDVSRTHELYQALLAPFADLTKGKQLIIVPSGPLTTLPFHVLVTDKPDDALTGVARYQKAAWLALQQPVTVLPSVGSLQALRKLGPSHAAEPYIAFGNPLLMGPSGSDKRAWDKQRCRREAKSTRAAGARGIAQRGAALRAINLAELRAQNPLPETADELCAVAEGLGAVRRESDTIWLGERATERNLKRLSREGKLARYKVIHFATHGLLSGESSAILNAKAEPALILTPPKDGATAAELEEDDGLLTASEVAHLNLDADWVVLSACNTAAGAGDAEALSGLARAFFYAKARALLVSHWYVNSNAAVKLTTKAFAALKTNPKIGRAEALRRSMAELIRHGSAEEVHPANWAPFVLVGEGAK